MIAGTHYELQEYHLYIGKMMELRTGQLDARFKEGGFADHDQTAAILQALLFHF